MADHELATQFAANSRGNSVKLIKFYCRWTERNHRRIMELVGKYSLVVDTCTSYRYACVFRPIRRSIDAWDNWIGCRHCMYCFWRFWQCCANIHSIHHTHTHIRKILASAAAAAAARLQYLNIANAHCIQYLLEHFPALDCVQSSKRILRPPTIRDELGYRSVAWHFL